MLNGLYAKHGVYRHVLLNKAFEGEQGMNAMKGIMTALRENGPTEIAGLKVVGFADYLNSVKIDKATGATTPIDLPKSDVVAFALEGNAGVIVRPSGTEPKIKAYVTATGVDMAAASAKADELLEAAGALLS